MVPVLCIHAPAPPPPSCSDRPCPHLPSLRESLRRLLRQKLLLAADNTQGYGLDDAQGAAARQQRGAPSVVDRSAAGGGGNSRAYGGGTGSGVASPSANASTGEALAPGGGGGGGFGAYLGALSDDSSDSDQWRPSDSSGSGKKGSGRGSAGQSRGGSRSRSNWRRPPASPVTPGGRRRRRAGLDDSSDSSSLDLPFLPSLG